MRKTLPLVILAAVLALDGVVYGLWTNRWRSPEALERAVARLENVPEVIGAWQVDSSRVLDEREAAQAGFTGHLVRTYKNRVSGQALTVMLACGPAGPLSVHTPDVCYRGAGYDVMKTIAKRTDAPAGAELWEARFGKPESTTPAELRVVWAWNVAGDWSAPDNPRFAFAGAPALYKLYVVQELMQDDRGADQVCADFLDQLLPELNRQLFPTGAKNDAPRE
jgi:hypothetical protein